MARKMKNIAMVILMSVILLSILSSSVFALDWDTAAGKINVDRNTGAASSVASISQTIIGIVQVIGIAVAIIMLVVLAIKYISSAPNDKAEIKKHAVVYVVGAVILFAASGILEIIKGFAGKI